MAKPHILLVDDSTAIQKVVRIAFARYEVTIDARMKLIEAELLLRKGVPDVMILDAGLLDSQEALEQFVKIRKSYNTRELKVVLLKSQHDEISPEDMEAINCQKIVSKPFETREIVNAILSFVDARQIETDEANSGFGAPSVALDEAEGTMPLPPPPKAGKRKPQEIKSEAENAPQSGDAKLPPPPPIGGRAGGKEAKKVGEAEIAPPASEGEVKAPEEKPDVSWAAALSDENDQSGSFEETTISQVRSTLEARKDAFSTTGDGDMSALLAEIPKVPLHHAEKRGKKAFSENGEKQPKGKKKLRVKVAANEEDVDSAVSPQKPPIPEFKQEMHTYGEFLADPSFQLALKQAVEDYCARHFDSLAREVITKELRRLADEKARHLLDD